MQTEWSPRHDATDGSAPPPDGAVDAVDHEVGVDHEVDAGTHDGITLDEIDEEDLHRSAVDAVDGLLDEVERALARLDDGTYGRCESCGAPIDDGRLAELPIVRTCGTCDEVGGGSTAPGTVGSFST